jgi:hypothetical protein
VSERRWDLLRHGYAANSGLHVVYQLVGDGPFTAHVGRERVSVPSAPARSTWVEPVGAVPHVISAVASPRMFLRRSGTRRRPAGRRELWVLEHLQPAVEGAVVDELESDVGVPVEDPVTAGGTGDDGEDDDPVAVHQARPGEVTG